MRYLKWTLLLLVGACATKGVHHLVQDSGSAHLVVAIEGVRSEKGELLVSLFATEEGFPGDAENALRRFRVPPQAPTTRLDIEDLPEGSYAVAVLHDENGDGKMDTNWMGAPSEGWTVSNDARGRFGPPSFADARFDYGGERATLTVHLSY